MNLFLKKYIIVVPALFLFGYVFIRAWKLSFTIDEAFSFLFYALDSYGNIFHFKLLDPNNHVLNSFFMKFFNSWLPLSELTLRTQSIIAHGLFMLFIWLILKDFKNTLFSICAWLILNLNPYMLDFFSLARGYALGWAMMTGSLYFLKQILEKDSKRGLNIIFCFLLAALSVMASFSMVNYYLALLCIFGVMALYMVIYQWKMIRSQLWFWGSLLFVLALSGLLLYYTIDISFKLQNAGYLYFGGIVGIWQDTVSSLVDSCLYGASYAGAMVIPLLMLIIVVPVLTIIFIIFRLIKGKSLQEDNYFFIALFMVLLFIIAGIMTSHSLLNTRVVIERAAVFIEIIFLFVLVFLIYHSLTIKYALPVVIFFGGLSVFHFFHSANFSYTYEWKSDASTCDMMKDLGRMHDENILNVNKNEVLFQPEWLFATSTMFYQYMYQFKWMEPVESVKAFTNAEDFYYFPENAISELKGQPVEIIKRYPLSGTILLKNTTKRKVYIFAKKQINFIDELKSDTSLTRFFDVERVENIDGIKIKPGIYSPSIKLNVNTLQINSNVILKASVKVFFPKDKCGDFVISIMDKDGKLVKWNAIGLGSYLLQKEGWITIPYKLNIDKWEPRAETIQIFLWNTGKDAIIAANMQAEILDYK